MATHITQIGKHKFICGLFWQSLSRPRELVKEATELARKIDSDLMVLRKDHATAQAGFAQTRDGARKMVYSLGAAVSKTLALEGANYDGQKQPAHNWLGAFKLPDGMWAYFAVRDANFLPNGDFAGTKEEVIDRLHGDYGLGGWNVVIGDAELEHFGFHNFNAKTIDDLLPKRRDGQLKLHRWWGLRPIEQKFTWLPWAAAGAVVLLLIAAGFLFWQRMEMRKAEEQRQRDIEAARQRMLGKAAPSGMPHPWPTKPLPQLTTDACIKKFGYFNAGGWVLEEYTCTPTQVSYAWTRQDSTIQLLLAQVPKAVVDLSGNRAVYSEAVQLATGRDEVLMNFKDLIEPLASKLQVLRIDPKLVKVIPPPPPPPPKTQLPGMKEPEVPRPDWETYTFSITAGGLPPAEIALILSQPGIRLDKLNYRSGAWTIEGALYAKLP